MGADERACWKLERREAREGDQEENHLQSLRAAAARAACIGKGCSGHGCRHGSLTLMQDVIGWSSSSGIGFEHFMLSIMQSLFPYTVSRLASERLQIHIWSGSKRKFSVAVEDRQPIFKPAFRQRCLSLRKRC